MKKAVPIGVLLGLLLALPWVLASTGVWNQAPGGSERDSWEAVPSLPLVERRQRLTFERPCAKPEDCEPPLGCLGGFAEGAAVCLDSECTTDLQCEEGFACHALRTLDRKRYVRVCVPAGPQDEGQACLKGMGIHELACQRGLRCQLFCGRPCLPGVPWTCPEGTACRDGPDGSSCQPTCEEHGCPSGQACIRVGSGSSICGVVRGRNCQQAPCAEGQECDVSLPGLFEDRNEVVMECIQRRVPLP